MIAETIEVSWPQIVASWFHAAVFLVGFQQEGRVVDMAVDELPGRCSVAENMVEAAPQAMKAIGAFCPVSSLCLCRYLYETMADEELERGVRRIVVEVASDDDAGLWRQGSDRIHRLQKAVDDFLSVGP